MKIRFVKKIDSKEERQVEVVRRVLLADTGEELRRSLAVLESYTARVSELESELEQTAEYIAALETAQAQWSQIEQQRKLQRYAQACQTANEAARRAAEGLTDSIAERDRKDSSRATAPLAQAPDALLVDTSDMTIDQVVRFITDNIQQKLSSR